MIDHNEYTVYSDGAISHCISVPCFSGDGEDFYYAMTMNRFYKSALEAMLDLAQSINTENVRRASYNASYSISTESDGISVTLTVSERLVYKDGARSTSVRKIITHKWQGGVITEKSAH